VWTRPHPGGRLGIPSNRGPHASMLGTPYPWCRQRASVPERRRARDAWDAPGWMAGRPDGEGASQLTVALNSTRRCGVAESPWPDMPSVIVLAFGLLVEPSDGEGL
jgi:hypothetical protein